MVLIKKSFNNTNIHNGDLTIKGELSADSVNFSDNSISPGAIGTTADSIQKLNESTGSGVDILNTSSTEQTKNGNLIVNNMTLNTGALNLQNSTTTNTSITMNSTGNRKIDFGVNYIEEDGNNPGELVFRNTASNSIMKVNSSGSAAIGINNACINNISLNLNSSTKAVQLPTFSSIDKNNYSSPNEGALIYNAGEQSLNVYGFDSWKTLLNSDHENTSTGIHGVNGSLLGTTDTQNISNKTLDSTNTVHDSSLSSNIPRLDASNSFTNSNTFNEMKTNLIKPTSDLSSIIIQNNASDVLMEISPTTGVCSLNPTSSAFRATRFENMAGVELKNITETLTNKSHSGTFTITDDGENFSQLLLTNNDTNLYGITLRSAVDDEVGVFSATSSSTANRLGFFSYNSVNGYCDTSGFDVPTGKSYRINGVNISTFTETLSNKILDAANCLVPHVCLDRTVLLNNQNDINNPTVNSDISLGYTENSIWHNSITNKHFICSDRTAGSAIWHEIITESSVQTLTNKTLSTGCVINTNQNITTSANLQGNTANLGGLNITGNTISSAVGDIVINSGSNLNVQSDLEINGVKVLTNQQSAVADATTGSDVITRFNELLTRLRTHGLIAT